MTLLRKFMRLLQWISPGLAVKVAAFLFASPRRFERPKYEQEWIKTAEKIDFECGLKGLKFGQGPAVMLVHGWEGRGSQLCAFAEPLVMKGYCVYAVDGPAHGESPGRQTTPIHFARFMMSVAQEIGPLKAVIAHSFGAGSTALAVHDGLDTENLILVAGPDRYAKVVDFFCNQIGFSESTRKLFHREVTQRVGMTPDSLQISKIAKKLKCRLLIVHDQDDKAVGIAASENIHREVPGSVFLKTQGLGHRRILRDPAVIEKVVNFIS